MARNPCLICNQCPSCSGKACKCWYKKLDVRNFKTTVRLSGLPINTKFYKETAELYGEGLKRENIIRYLQETYPDQVNDNQIKKKVSAPKKKEKEVENPNDDKMCVYEARWYREKCIYCGMPRGRNKEWICIK